MIDREKIPKTPSEKFFCENTKMIYVDAPYYDFLIIYNKEDGSHEIRVEDLSNHYTEKDSEKNSEGGPLLRFKIRMGRWIKFPGSDFILTLTENNIFYGFSCKINEHLDKTLRAETIQLSYRPRKKGLVYTERPVFDLERMKLLKPISKSDVNELEDIIKKDYEQNYRISDIRKNYNDRIISLTA